MAAKMASKAIPVPVVTDTGVRGLIKWIRLNDPKGYKLLTKNLPVSSLVDQSKLGSLGETVTDSATGVTTTFLTPTALEAAAPSTSGNSKWLDTIQNILTAGASAYLTKTQVDSQKKLLDAQLERAKLGLAPLNIDPQSYGLPGASVSVGLASGTQKLLMYGGIGLLAVLLLKGMRRA